MLTLLAPILALAEEAEAAVEESKGIDLLIPETSELIAGSLAFAIIFFFVWKWVLPAVNRTLEARREAITGQVTGREDQGRGRGPAGGLQQADRQRSFRGQHHRRRGQGDCRSRQGRHRRQGQDRGRGHHHQGPRGSGVREGIVPLTAIRGEISSLSVDLAQKASAGAMDEKAHKALVDQFLDELDGMA